MAIQLSKEQAGELHEQIAERVYDILDRAVDGIERSPQHERYSMAVMMKPLIDQARNAADVIGEHFTTYFQEGTLSREAQSEVEKMLRFTFSEVHDYLDKLSDIQPTAIRPGDPERITTIDRNEQNILLELVPELPYLDQGPGQSGARQERIRTGFAEQ